MSKAISVITHKTLPVGYKNLVPHPGGSFPIVAQIKDKVEWRCTVCGFIDNLSVDNMRANPRECGLGCKACTSALRLIGSLKRSPTSHSLSASSWFFDHDNRFAATLGQRFKSLIFECQCNNGHRHQLSQPQLYYSAKKSFSCPECAEEQKLKKIEELVDPVREYFSGSVIRYAGDNKWKKPYFTAFIPGSDGSPDVHALGRIRGSFGTAEKGRQVSLGELLRMMNQDLKDRDRIKEFIDVGAQFGSVVLSVGLIPGKNELGAEYLNAMGVTKEFYCLYKARTYSAGRPIKKQHQALIQCVVMEAFPGNEWVNDDRTYLGELIDRYGCCESLTPDCELDIGTNGIVEGGLWLEYQGHQNHDEGGDSVERDRAKVQVCANRCLLLVIPRIKTGDVQQAIQNVKHALESHPDRDRAEKALAQWEEPDPGHVHHRWLKAFPEMAKDCARRLKESMAQHGHTVLNEDLEIHSDGTFSYQCGYCGEHSHDNKVRSYTHQPAKGCSACESQRMLEHGERGRCERWSEHSLWTSLPDETKKQLCDNSLKADCPKCGSEVGKEPLSERDDYFCLCCLDTGRIITSNGQSGGTVFQNLKGIKEVILAIDETPLVRFEDQISVEGGKIVLTLTVNGMTRRLPLTEWKRELKRPYSTVLHQEEDRFLAIKIAFPRYKLVESDSPGTVCYDTGMGTKLPGAEVIPHPVTAYKIRQLAPLLNEAGGMQRQSKNVERGDRDTDVHHLRSKLSCMYDLQNSELNSRRKTLSEVAARYKLRAAMVGNTHIPREHRRETQVVHETLRPIDYIQTTGSEAKCLFYCGDNRHPPEEHTPDSRFNPAKRYGFCKKCLEAAGLLHIDFRALEQEAEIVNLD